MKYLFLSILIFIDQCKKECVEMEKCNCNSLEVIDSASIDLRKYTTRNDSTSLYGLASGIKSVPNKGEIVWMANNSIQFINNEHYLIFKNYSDTDWVNLELWANRREVIAIKLTQLTIGTFQIVNETSYLNNKSLNYAVYNKFIDEYPDASWDIDMKKENFIHIISIDSTKNLIEGEFDLNFEIKTQSTLPTDIHSNIIGFRCGHFRVHEF